MRHVPEDQVAAEFEFAWWQSALEAMLRTDRALLGANTSVVDRLERAGLDAYSSLGQTLDDVAAGFSEDELRVVLRWFQALSAASSAE